MDNDQFMDDPVEVYLAEVNKVPPLTTDEEIRCVQLILAGDPEAELAQKRLVESNLNLAVAIAKRYATDDIHVLHLIENGNEGLLNAARTLSKSDKASFAAYAAPLIESAIEAFIASPKRIQKVPVHLRHIVEAIQSGDVMAMNRIISAVPALVHRRIDGERTLLHVATDWPGHFPHVQETIAALVAHGADVNAPFQGSHSERPLHWAASSDDLDALNALLDHGADIEAAGSVIDGGTPLADAVAFRQWRSARRLIDRGARSTIWQAAALGLMDRVEAHFASDPHPSPDIVTNLFWNACHGGQSVAAEYLLARGADLNWVGHGGLTALDTAVRFGNAELIEWLQGQGAVSALGSD